MPLNDQTRKEFERWGKALPTTEEHGTEDQIRENMTPLQPKNWRMQGNKLIADTEMGELVQMMPTNLICKGTDKKGLPILVKLD